MKDPSSSDSFPIRPTGPDGLLFEGPEYRYTFVAPLADAHDPMAIARRTSLHGESVPCLVILKRVQMPPEDRGRAGSPPAAPRGSPGRCRERR